VRETHGVFRGNRVDRLWASRAVDGGLHDIAAVGLTFNLLHLIC